MTTTNNISTVCIEFPDEQPPRRLSARQRREALRGLARVHYLIGDRDGDVMACRCGHGNTAHRRFTGRCMTATGPDLQCPCVQLWPDPGSYWLLDG